MWDEGQVQYTRGKTDTSQTIQSFMGKRIGCLSTSPQQPVFSLEEAKKAEKLKEDQPGPGGLFAVLAGGPEGHD